LKPVTVISGHHDPSRPDAPSDLGATARYIDDFQRAVAAGHSPDDVVKAMTASYPNLGLPIVLGISAKAAFGGH
jgi:hypothetical protein